MADVIFYEKPGCANNTRQKQLLQEAGHNVEARNLLTETWTRQSLLEYFDGVSVSLWFNRSAPDIKSGKIDPSAISEQDALDMMIQNPLLIRRPLMRVGNQYRIGFDAGRVDQWIGLKNITGNEKLESCSKAAGHSCAPPAE